MLVIMSSPSVLLLSPSGEGESEEIMVNEECDSNKGSKPFALFSNISLKCSLVLFENSPAPLPLLSTAQSVDALA